MHLEVLRYKTGSNATLGVFLINGMCQCYTIEDTRRFVKKDGETRIPSGRYNVQLRTEGGMTRRYGSRFSDFHKGMLWLQDVPGFEYVYIHIGNNEEDTEGCILLGDDPLPITKDAFVAQSTLAYKRLYPMIAGAILRGDSVTISVKDYA